MQMRWSRCALAAILVVAPHAVAQDALPGTEPLTWEGDLAERMVTGISTDLDTRNQRSVEQTTSQWNRDVSSYEAYVESVEPRREELRRIIGAVDERLPARMDYVASVGAPAKLGEGDGYTVYRVRWPVFAGVHGEGLMLEPHESARANVVALPDCDWQPEDLVFATGALYEDWQYAQPDW